MQQDRPAYGPFLDADFTWGPPRGELAWVTHNETCYLTTGTPALMVPVRRRRPLVESPALFRRFADLQPGLEAILAFAQEWGHLGAMETIPRRPSESGESLDRWRREIRTLRDAVRVWDAVQHRDVDSLKKVIRVSRGQAWFESGDAGRRAWRTIYDEGRHLNPTRAVLGAGDQRSSVLRAALFFVGEVVNQKLTELSDHVSPALVYTCDPERLDLLDPTLNERTRARLVAAPFDPAKEHLRVGVHPKTLLGALWLQFARAVDGGFRYITCESCGKWIEVSASDRRRQRRRFCNATCRVNRNRRKAGRGHRRTVGAPARR